MLHANSNYRQVKQIVEKDKVKIRKSAPPLEYHE